MAMKRNYTLNLFYVLCVVIVFLIYPVKNYSAFVNLSNPAEGGKKIEKPVGQESVGFLPMEFLFKY